MNETLGAVSLGNDRCRFRVWAPLHANVEVHLLSPDRLIPLSAKPNGYHEGEIDGVPAGTLYFFRLSNGLDRPDPASRHQPAGVHGPSEIVALDFSWTADDWRGIPLRDHIFYELHVGTFTTEGTFDAAIGRLDDLVELGITAVELMPIAQFPGSRNWGYDGAYPYAVQSSYGGPSGLARFVDACHARGLAVVLDVVYNHLGPEGTYLADFGPYFTNRYHNDWAASLNFDGPGSDAVRDYFLRNAFYWLCDLRIDALRLDAVNFIQDGTPKHFLEELGEAVEAERSRMRRPIYLIAELLMNDPKYCRPRSQFGYGMDAQWCDDFHHALHARLTGERQGYYQDFGSLTAFAQALQRGYFFTGQPSRYRQRRHGRAPTGIKPDQLVVYAQNHDQIGNRMQGERLATMLPFEALKLVAAATILSPNLPLLFMGEEYGETRPFPFFISHGDPALIEAVRLGRKCEFAHFNWAGEPPDPQNEETFRSAKLQWKFRAGGDHETLWKYYQYLLQLRKFVTQGDVREIRVECLEEANVIVLSRKHGREQTCLVLHFGSTTNRFDLGFTGVWYELLNSNDVRWRGHEVETSKRKEFTLSTWVEMVPYQALLLGSLPLEAM